MKYQLRSTQQNKQPFFKAALLLVLSFSTLTTLHADPPVAIDLLPEQPERLFVPVEKFPTILAGDRQGVLLPKAQFEELWAAARKNQNNIAPGKQSIVVSGSRYQARVEDRQLIIEAQIDFHQYFAAWTSFPLSFRNLAVEEATIDDQPAALGRNEKGELRVFYNQPGKHLLKLKLTTQLAAVGSDQVAAFTLLEGVPAQLTVAIPAGKHLQYGELSLARPTAADQPAEYNLPVGGDPAIRLRITDRNAENKTDSLVFANSLIGIDASPGKTTWQALTQLQIYGGTYTQILLTVPAELEVADVVSSGLESWILAEDEDDSDLIQITLTYRQPISGQRQIRLRGVMTHAAGEAWEVPRLQIKSANSHVGHILVTHPYGVRIQFVKEDGLRRSAAPSTQLQKEAFLSQLPERTAPQVFDFWREDFSLEILMQSRDRELIANIQNLLDLNYESLRYVAEIKLACRYAPLFEFDLELPADWVPVTMQIDNQPVEWQDVSPEAGTRRLRVTPPAPLLAGGELTLRLETKHEMAGWPPTDEAAEVELPQVTLPQVNLFDGRYYISADSDFDVRPLELSGLNQVNLNRNGERSAYEYQDTEIEGVLSITRRATQISAETLTYARLDPGALRAHVEATISLEGAGPKQLQIALPEAAGTNVRFQVAGSAARLLEQAPAEPANGQIVWTLSFDRRLYGTIGLTADLTLPRDETKKTSAVPKLIVENADRQSGVVAIEAGPEQSLTLSAIGFNKVGLREIDPIELPASLSGYQPQERIVGVYRYVRPDYSVTLEEERFARTAVPTAVCHQLELNSIVGDSGLRQHEAVVDFSAVGVQNLQVQLPEGAVLLSSLLDETPIEVRKVGTHFLVPLGGGASGTSRHQLQLFYNNQAKKLGEFGTVEETPPAIAVEIDGKLQPLEILNQQWNLYTPDGVAIIASDGLFQPEYDFRHSGLIGELNDDFSRISWEHVVQVLIGAAIVTVNMVVCFFLFRRTTAGQSVAIVSLLLLIGVIVLAVMIPAVQQYENGAMYKESAPAVGSAMTTESATEFDSDGYMEMEAVAGEEMRGLGAMPESSTAETKPATPPTPMAMPNEPSAAAKPADPFAGMDKSEMEEAKSLELARDTVQQAESQVRGETEFAPMMSPEFLDAEGLLALNLTGGARLSVAVDFQIPQSHRETELRYYGTQTAGEAAPLKLTYLNDTAACALTGLVASITLLFFYVIRHRSWGTRLSWLILGIAGSLAAGVVVPARFAYIPDGILVGSLLAAGCWLACCICCCCCMPLCRKYCGKWWARKSALPTAMLLLSFTLSSAALAEDKKAAPPIVPPIPQLEWKVIIPYDPAEDPLSADRVFLNSAQFRELWNQAHPEQPLGVENQPDGHIARVAFVAEPEGTGKNASVKVTARFVIHLLREGPRSIALPLQSVALESATLDDKPAPLTIGQNKKQPAYRVLISTPGVHLLDMTFRLPLDAAGEAGQFSLPLDGPTNGTLTVRLPEQGLSVRVNGTTTAYRKVTAGDSDSIVVPLALAKQIDNAKPISVSWTPPAMGAGVDRIVHVETQSGLRVDDTGLTLKNRFRYSVKQGAVEELLFQLPDGWSLQELTGPDVGGWQPEENNNQRLVRVFLRRAIDDATALDFTLFNATEQLDDALEATYPRLTPLEITRETGHLGLFSENHYLIRAGAFDHLTRVQNDTFPDLKTWNSTFGPLQLAFRFSRNDYELPFSVLRKAPEAKSISQHGLTVGRTRAPVASRFQIDLSGTPRSRVSILLPEGYVILDVQASALEDWYQTESPDGDMLLIVEFPTPMTGQVQIALEGYLRKEPGDEIAELFLPVLLEMSEDKTTFAIWPSGNYKLSIEEFDGWKQIDVRDLPPELRNLRPEKLSFAFEGTQILDRYVALLIEQVQPTLSADTVSILNVTDTSIVYQLAMKWTISEAQADRFVFTTPESFAGKLDFQGAPFLQNYSSELTDDGTVRWTIFLSQPQSESYFLSPLAVLPVPRDGVISVPRLVVERFPVGEEAGFQKLASQRHFAVLVNQSNSQLSVNDPELLEPLSQRDLPINPDQTLIQQATDIFRLRSDRELPAWTMKTFEQKRGAAAIINYAELTTVLENDGSWRMHAAYLIRNRGRQFLPLKLPAGSRLLSAAVKQQPVRPVKTTLEDAEITLLPLPKASEGDTSFYAEVVLAGRLSSGQLLRGVESWGDDFDLPAPSVVSSQDAPELGIPVSRTRWNVWLPDRLTATQVDQINRTNLSPQQIADADAEVQLIQLKEVNDLLSSADNNANQAVQFNAFENAKRVEQQLETRFGRSSNGRSSRENELRAEVQKLQANTRQLQENIAQQQRDYQTNTYEYSINNFSDLDAKSQLDTLIQGNRQLYNANGIGLGSSSGSSSIPQIVMEQAPSSGTFRFIVPQRSAGKDVAVKGKQLQKSEQSQTFEKKRLSNSASNDFFSREQMNAPQQQAMEGDFGVNQTPNQMGFAGGRSGSSSNRRGVQQGQGVPTPESQLGGFGVQDRKNNYYTEPMLGDMDRIVGVNDPNADLDNVLSLTIKQTQTVWDSSTGLSLTFDIPKLGHPLTFTKVGGDPRLALEVAPRDSYTLLTRAIWFLLWGGAAIVLIRLFATGGIRDISRQKMLLVAGGFALVLAIVLPGVGTVLGAILFVAAGIALVAFKIREEESTQAAGE